MATNVNPMIEKLAKKLCELDGCGDVNALATPYALYTVGHLQLMPPAIAVGPAWTFYVRKARAVIEEMKEPTGAMLDAGPGDPYLDKEVWVKIMNAALK